MSVLCALASSLALVACASPPRPFADGGPIADTVNDAGCVPGTILCDGATRYTCGSNGARIDPLDCARTEGVCAPGLGCVRCIPNARRCNPSVPNATEVCSGDGARWTPGEVCNGSAAESCEAGRCVERCAGEGESLSNVGCDFFPTTTPNLVTHDVEFAIVATNLGTEPVQVSVTGGALEGTVWATVPPEGATPIVLPWVRTVSQHSTMASSVSAGAGYRVRSSRPIAVYQFSPLYFRNSQVTGTYTNDASLLLPVTALGRNYVATTYSDHGAGGGTWMALVGVAERPTRVSFRGRVALATPGAGSPGGTTAAIPADTESSATLARGDVLILSPAVPTESIAGTRVRADAPIAAYAGNYCTFIPADRPYCDHLEEQLLPIEAWGRQYAVAPFADRPSMPIIVHVTAAADDTTVRFDPPTLHAPATLRAGETLELETNVAFVVTGSAPLQVASYMEGRGAPPEGPFGDPAQVMAVPVEQYRRDYTFYVPETYDRSFVTIVGTQGTTPVLDGQPVTLAPTAIGTSELRTWSVEVLPGTHRLTGVPTDARFGIQVYGVADATSYAYPGGLDLEVLNRPPE